MNKNVNIVKLIIDSILPTNQHTFSYVITCIIISIIALLGLVFVLATSINGSTIDAVHIENDIIRTAYDICCIIGINLIESYNSAERTRITTSTGRIIMLQRSETSKPRAVRLLGKVKTQERARVKSQASLKTPKAEKIEVRVRVTQRAF